LVTSIGFGVTAALTACGSSGNGGPSTSAPDPAAAQEPGPNPETALINGEVPLPNAQQPGAPAQEPPLAPGPAGGGGALPSSDRCLNFCFGLGGTCGNSCASNCTGLTSLTGPCAGAVNAYLDCLGQVGLVCRPNGKIETSGLGSCIDDVVGVTDCFGGGSKDDSPPDNSGPGSGPGRGNDNSGN
jgi:hypothetical protein